MRTRITPPAASVEPTFLEYSDRLLASLDIDSRTITGSTLLVDDLGLDSLGIYLVVLVTEELANVETVGALPTLATMQDAYTYYESVSAVTAHSS